MTTNLDDLPVVVVAIAGDWDAARDVQLDLPETGVCNSNAPVDSATIDGNVGCCGAPTKGLAAPAGRGLVTGIAGGLLSRPLTLVSVTQPVAGEQTGRCRG